MGPWLENLYQYILKDGKILIKVLKNQVYENIYLNLKPKKFIPYDYIEFQKFSFNDYYWNQYIYQKIFREFFYKTKRFEYSKIQQFKKV